MLASEYGWARQVIWHEIPLPEIMLYISQIGRRKQIQYGTGDSEPVDEDLINLLEVIETVKRERNQNGQ